MALNIPMPTLPGQSFLQGVDTGSTMFSRMIQPVIERERLKQQQDQFVQNLALQKEQEARQQSLMPYLIQQYQDVHKAAANEAAVKQIYQNLIQGALANGTTPPNAPPAPVIPTTPQPNAAPDITPVINNTAPNIAPPVPGAAGAPPAPGMPPNAPTPMATTAGVMPQDGQGEHELRPGNPRLAKLDSIAGLVPGIPKPVQHISNGMIFTTYPSGRMTVQKVSGQAGETTGERQVSAKEASTIRDQATALINSANLVNQGYDLLDNNPDLTGIGSGLASAFNLSSNPDLGNFTTVTGKLQAELGKYAASRGGIQAVKWASSVKPSAWKPEDYNYGMFDGIKRNISDEYNTLNAQYKAATGQDLPVPLPQMGSKRPRPGSSGTKETSDGKKVTKTWNFSNGKLV